MSRPTKAKSIDTVRESAKTAPDVPAHRKLGRPSRPEEFHRNVAVRVLVTRSENEILQVAAARQHASVSTWARMLLLETAARIVGPEKQPALGNPASEGAGAVPKAGM